MYQHLRISNRMHLNFPATASLWIFGCMLLFHNYVYALRGPMFLKEPVNKVVFHNSSGTVLPCAATGVPSPTIYWSKNDGTRIQDVPGLRHLRPDGSLVFQPFRAEDYRQDVHDSSYRCIATNSFGSIGSVEIRVKGVVLQEYQAHVYDEYVIHGNTAVFRCQVPTFIKEFLNVVSWSRDDGLVINHHGNTGAKYVVLKDDELHIRNAVRNDSFKRYRCQVKNSLTSHVSYSVTSGQLIVTDPSGSIPPRITSGRAAVEVQEGENAELPCTAQAYPLPTYRWYRKDNNRMLQLHLGERISQANGTLFLDRVMAQDSGKYICVVNNSVGEEKVDSELTVYSNLSVTLHPSMLKLESGRSATLNCSATGYPVRSTTWLKDMRPLVPNNRIRLIANQILHITSALKGDEGMYQCMVYGAIEAVQSAAQIILSADAPELKFAFSRQTVQPGDRFSLRCVAGGNPLPRVTWLIDSRPIPENHRVQYGDFVSTTGEVVSFVNVTAARSEDGGEYECRAQNEAGSFRHTERVDIAGPPHIKVMGNITVVAGESILYRCPVSGFPLPAVTWTKENRELPFNDRQQLYANGSFFLSDVSREVDEGTYTCSARNKQGQRAQKQLRIRVIKKPVINPFAFPKSLTEGMHVIETCSVLTGDPPITVRWLKDGMTLNRKMLNIEESSLGNLGSSLVFSSVGRSHNGNYTCLAENMAGEANYSATMLVNVPPSWTIEPVDSSAVVSESVVFDCQAEGYPQPLIRWKKATGNTSTTRNFKSIVSNYHIQTLENGSLSIKDLDEIDGGFYLCEAANGVGADLSTVVRLSVHVAANFKTSFRVHKVSKGYKLNIQCEAFGEQPINIQWYKDKVLLDPDAEPRYNIRMFSSTTGIQSVLSVSQPDRRDSALFSCTAINIYGKDDTNIQVLVEEVPDPPSDVVAMDVGSRSVHLSWSVPFSGNSPLTKYHMHWKTASATWSTEAQILEISGTNTSTTITGLFPITTYHFKLQAENALGRSPFSDTITATTSEEVPSEPPTDVETIAISSHTIRVLWKPPPRKTMNGKIRGYYVGYRIQKTAEPFIYKTLEQSDSESAIECTITNLRRATEYEVTVQAFNNKGAGPSSKISYLKTHENDPPPQPNLRASSTSAESVELEWDLQSQDINHVKGYKLFYKNDFSEWDEIDIPASHISYTLHHLNCGTRYHFRLSAFNDVGQGESSEIISVRTDGRAPMAPGRRDLMILNTTFIVLILDTWETGGCSISYFEVRYKERWEREWTLVINNLRPKEETFILSDLKPGTWYSLLMASHNGAGVTEAQYEFATYTLAGGTVTPMASERDDVFSLYRNVSVLVPIICAVVVLLVITFVVLFVCMKKNRNPDYAVPPQGQEQGGDQKGDTISMASVGKKLYETPRETLYYPSPYATTRISMYSADSESSSGQTNSLQRTALGQAHATTTRPEHTYDIPFPQKQFSGPTRYSAPSHDYQALFRDSAVHQLIVDTGDEDRRHLVVQRMCLQHQDSKQRSSPSFMHRQQHQHQQHQLQQSPQHQQQRIYRLNRRSDPNARYPTTQDYLSDVNSDEEDSSAAEKACLQGNTADIHELSEAECDRDYLQHMRKGSHSPFVKFRMSNCGLCIDKE